MKIADNAKSTKLKIIQKMILRVSKNLVPASAGFREGQYEVAEDQDAECRTARFVSSKFPCSPSINKSKELRPKLFHLGLRLGRILFFQTTRVFGHAAADACCQVQRVLLQNQRTDRIDGKFK